MTSPLGIRARLEIWMREQLLRILARWKAPGLLREMEYSDPLSNQHLQVRVEERFTVLTVNGREFYFARLSGKFDGTGSSV